MMLIDEIFKTFNSIFSGVEKIFGRIPFEQHFFLAGTSLIMAHLPFEGRVVPDDVTYMSTKPGKCTAAVTQNETLANIKQEEI